jgi:hypothetical protein
VGGAQSKASPVRRSSPARRSCAGASRRLRSLLGVSRIGRSRVVPALCAVLVAVFAGLTLRAPAAASAGPRQPADYWFVDKWGGLGTGDGMFDDPHGVAVAPDGTVYVYDGGNFRVQWFDGSGTYLGQFGSQGFNDGQFKYPHDLAVDPTGTWLYVGDRDLAAAHVEQFAIGPPFAFVRKFWVGDGTGGQFDPTGIDVAADGDVYVVEEHLNRVQRFEADGTPVAQWGSSGAGNGQFTGPQGVAVAPAGSPNAGRVYVADTGNKRVQYFDPPFDAPTYGYAGQWTVDSTWGPTAIDVGPDGMVYVCGLFEPRCRYYTPSGGAPPNTSGTPPGSWSTGGSADGRTFRPWGIAVGLDDTVYVSDTKYDPMGTPISNDRVQAFRRDPLQPVTSDDAPHGAIDTAAGWSRQNPLAVTLTRADDLAGIWNTGWRVAPDDPVWGFVGVPVGPDECAPPLGPFPSVTITIFGEGVHTLEYYSEDNASRRETTHSVPVRIDSLAPVTTADAPGPQIWNHSPVSVHFSADDSALPGPGVVTSGVAATQSSLDGGSTWQTGGALTVGAEGRIAVIYRSLDVAGNVEAVKQCTVLTDFTAPTTTAPSLSAAAPNGWSRVPLTVHLTAGDAKPGATATSGVFQTFLRVTAAGSDGPWQSASDKVFSNDGDFTLWYYSTDFAGNAETPKSCRIRIDTGAPVPAATRNVTVKRGRNATLRYRVVDAWSPTCAVVIKIFNARGKLVKAFKPGAKASNTSLTKSFRCNLPNGRYRWSVYATDLAGNVQAKPGSKALIVL